MDARLQAPVIATRLNVVAVVSPRGGAGTTTTSWVLADALAGLRRLAVVAIDAGPGDGTLGRLVPSRRLGEHTVVDLLVDHPEAEALSAAALDRYVSVLPSGLRVLAAAEPSAGLSTADLDRAMGLVERAATVAVVDCGAGVDSPAGRWAMRAADRVLVVCAADGSARQLDRLEQLAEDRRVGVVVNRTHRRATSDRRPAAVRRHAPQVGRRFALPYDAELRAMVDGAAYEPDVLRRAVRMAIKDLAVDVAEGLR